MCVCRLIAQLHDELLYEVEDSQVQQFAGKKKIILSAIDNFKKKVQVKFYLNKGQSNSFSTLLFL